MMAVPFSLVAIHDRWKRRTGASMTDRFTLPIVALLIVYMAIDGLISFGPSKEYIEQAGIWLRENTLESETVFSMESGLLFKAGKLDYDTYLADRKDKTADRSALRKKNIFDTLANNDWKKYNYLAIRVGRKQQELENAVLEIVDIAPVKVFSNKRGDRMLIFNIRK